MIVEASLAVFEKVAAVPLRSVGLSGELYLSGTGWLLLSVPNAFVRGTFAALDQPGVELPLHEGRLDAHISVMRPEEIDKIGGPQNITERGKRFHYTLGDIFEVVPLAWGDISKVWYIRAHSPALQKLRRSYGLSSKPHEGKYEFHITFAIRRVNVLNRNAVSKATTEGGNRTSLLIGKTAAAVLFDRLKTAQADVLAAKVREASKRIAEPTTAQAVAGNYRMGHLWMHGIPITLEAAKGSTRKGTDKAGKPWSRRMRHHYGYIKRTVGANDTQLAVYVGDDPQSEIVFVIDQIDPKTGEFDEHKICCGWKFKKGAVAAYLSHYPKNWKGLGSVAPLTIDQFKTWLTEGNHKKPIASQTIILTKTAEVEGQKIPTLIIHRSTRVCFVAPKASKKNDRKSATAATIRATSDSRDKDQHILD